jgi:hypothetical protein
MGSRIAAASAFRQNAIDIEGASARRTRIEENATDTTPRTRRPRCRGDMRPLS